MVGVFKSPGFAPPTPENDKAQIGALNAKKTQADLLDSSGAGFWPSFAAYSMMSLLNDLGSRVFSE
jgi:hypothetical protein